MPRAIHLAGPFVLLSFALPLFSLAIFSTIAAFSVLFFRVAIVYLELGAAVISSWLFGEKVFKFKPKIINDKAPSSVQHTTKRLPSMRGRTGGGTLTPFYDTFPYHKRAASIDTFTVGPGGTSRDYEGVGGWRLSGNKEEEASWLAMNSRLELPSAEADLSLRHRRNLSTPRLTRSPSTKRASPMASRNRTPPPENASWTPEGYFSLRPIKAGQMSPEEFAARLRMEERRASVGSASGGSSHGAVTMHNITISTSEAPG